MYLPDYTYIFDKITYFPFIIINCASPGLSEVYKYLYNITYNRNVNYNEKNRGPVYIVCVLYQK